MVIDFHMSLFEYDDEPGIYDAVVRAYTRDGQQLQMKTWKSLSAHKAVGMFSAFRVRVIRQYNPITDAPPTDAQLELPF